MNYCTTFINEQNSILRISYENSKHTSKGAYCLMDYIQNDLSAKIERRENGGLILCDQVELEWKWEKGSGLEVTFLKIQNHLTMCHFMEPYLYQLNHADAQITLDKLNEFLGEYIWFDFSVSNYADDLYLIGGIDLCYYYQMEIRFHHVSYIQCSTEFSVSPDEGPVFTLATPDEINKLPLKDMNLGFTIMIKINADNGSSFYVACYGLEFEEKIVKYDKNGVDENSDDKEKLIEKYRIFHEKDGWYEERENAHKHLIFKNSFYQHNDVLGLLFRVHQLCYGKVNYFRKNMEQYEPCKYDYKQGFITVPLWDSECLKHKASGMILDYGYLRTITVYKEFADLCAELEGVK